MPRLLVTRFLSRLSSHKKEKLRKRDDVGCSVLTGRGDSAGECQKTNRHTEHQFLTPSSRLDQRHCAAGANTDQSANCTSVLFHLT